MTKRELIQLLDGVRDDQELLIGMNCDESCVLVPLSGCIDSSYEEGVVLFIDVYWVDGEKSGL